MFVTFKSNVVLLFLFFQVSCIRCWLFNSVYMRNDKVYADWDADEGVYPIPYESAEAGDFNEINEDDPPDPPKERVILIWPGTKWCGPGNIASNYHDVGVFNETDKCCRRHDLCGDIIPAGHMAHGLTNDEFYTKLNCKCDDRFYKCLKDSKDAAGDSIGKVYFNAIGTQCFKNDFPVVKCLKYRGLFRKKCVEYEYDTSKPKEFQWFDVPPY